MDSGETAEKRAVTNRDMTAEHVTLLAKVTCRRSGNRADVASDHEKQRSPTRVTPPPSSVPVFIVDAFADIAARPDNQLRGAAAVMHRLRRRPERGKRIDDSAFADRRDAGDMNVGDQAHAVAKLDIRPDCAVGTDLDTVAMTRAPSATRAVGSIAI
jgi:hypothetical protein